MLAVASAGGHWDELAIIKGAFDRYRVHYVNTNPSFTESAHFPECSVVNDCNRHDLKAAMGTVAQLYRLIKSFRPDVVVTTGAMPGLISLVLGKLTGSYCIWIDSIANADRLSLSGRAAALFCDLCVVQWPHLVPATSKRIIYLGSVL